jgi:two-component system response regulator QseB
VADDADTPRVLVAEDDPELAELLRRLLGDAGYRVTHVPDGQAALHAGLTGDYDVLLIDRGLPALDGVDVIRRLRSRGVGTPAMVLTAYGSLSDRVSGLDAGAEDYLVKPFEVAELLARLRALRRRHHTDAEVLPLGSAQLDLGLRVVRTADGRETELSAREAALLRTLAARPTRVYTRDELRELVFDSAESASLVDTYVHYLRRKLGAGVVRTVRGIGYRAGGL